MLLTHSALASAVIAMARLWRPTCWHTPQTYSHVQSPAQGRTTNTDAVWVSV